MRNNIWGRIQENSIYDVSAEKNKPKRKKNKMLDKMLNDYSRDAKIFMALHGYTKKGFYESLKARNLLPMNTHHKSKKNQPIEYSHFTRLLNNDIKYPFEVRRDLFIMILEFSSAKMIELEKQIRKEKQEILELSKQISKKDLDEVNEIRDTLEKAKIKYVSI